MNGNEYQRLAMRTNDHKLTSRLAKIGVGCPGVDIGGIVNGCLGLTGEAGEFADIVKKWVFHEKPLNMEHAKKELGDVLWYAALICDSFGWELDEVMSLNIEKLQKRYPEGFTPEQANNRKAGDI